MANQKKGKKGIDLFVLLVHEQKPRVVSFLKKYGVPDSDEYNSQELYNALYNLYFNNPPISQKELDKELAEMHPHKDWILRVTTPDKNEFEVLKNEEPKKEKQQEEKKLSMEGEKKSPCDGCQSCPASSSFLGSQKPSVLSTNKDSSEDRQHYFISLIALVAVVGLTYKFVTK